MFVGLVISTLLAHGATLSVLAALAASALVFGIVAGAPDGGAGGDGDGGATGDGDAGDGGADAGDGQDGGDGGDGAQGERQHAGGDGDDGQDDDDDDADAGLSDEIRNDPKRLRTRYRRIQRQFGAVRPIAERFRDGNGRFLPPQEIDRMIGRAHDMAELEEFFGQHPDVVQTIVERRRNGGRSATAAAAQDAFVDPFADESQIPWDTATPEGKALVDHLRRGAKESHELRTMVRQLKEALGQVTQRDTARTIAGVEQQWKTATLAAAQQVPDVSRRTFVNAVYRAFELAKTRGELRKVSVQRILDSELEPYIRANRGKQRQQVAGQQQRAERTQTIPRPGRGQTSAANPKETNRVGTIRDGRKSFFERIGMSAPPR